MADSHSISGRLLDPRMDNTGNRNGAGNKGSKRTTTLVKELYDGALLEIASHRMKAIMEQIARDAENEELAPGIRQRAQAMIMQAAQKAGDQEIEKEKQLGNEALEIEISRDGVLVKSGRNMVRIDGGGGSRQAGVEGEVVPYSSYTTPLNSDVLSPDLDTYTGLRGDKYMVCSPGSNIPLTEFVGPPRDPKILQQLFLPRKHDDPMLADLAYPEYYCIDRPASMNFNIHSIGD